MGETKSCSACCGLFNLKDTDEARRAWVRRNTDEFMNLDISQAANIVNYRKEREAVTLPQRVREDIYVCPFIGYVDAQNLRTDSRHEHPPSLPLGPTAVVREPSASLRTGCLLHPQGSPHPQIGLWAHPQNFSFYGEGICLSYDCLAKERRVYRPDFFRWAGVASVFDYARLASDHTLHRTLAELKDIPQDLSHFYTALASLYARHNTPMTSFEDVEKTLPESLPALCHFLAQRIDMFRAAEIAAELAAAAG